MSTLWSDGDVRTACIFLSEPADCRVDLLSGPTFAHRHASVPEQDANSNISQPIAEKLLTNDRSGD